MEGEYPNGLIEYLEKKQQKDIDQDNPFYWYLHLQMLGKREQTKELVDEAVKNFNVNNHAYPILKVISKKHLTREVCEVAVAKNGLNLKYVPKQYLDTAMCLAAVKNDGRSLAEVPEQILLGESGYQICLAAVCNDLYGRALSFVPACYLRGKDGKALCKAAVKANGYALEFVPKRLITQELAALAIECSLPTINVFYPDGFCLPKSAYRENCPIVSFVPKKCLTKDLVALSARRYPESLQWIPSEYISYELCLELVNQDPMNLQYIPHPDKSLVDYVLKNHPQAILAVPEPFLTFKRCKDALRRDPTISIENFPDAIRKKLERECSANTLIKYEPIKLETPVLSNKNHYALSKINKSHIYDLAATDSPFKTIYYITDIHLEHQLVKHPSDIGKLSVAEIKRRIQSKISKLLASVPDTNGILLIGGDVADSIEVEALFYEQLSFGGWRGKIIAILGNHELWDGNPSGLSPTRPIDAIIANYRETLSRSVTLLENQLLIVYKGLFSEILDESTILNTSVEELTKVCTNSSFLLLGGIGFSGLNPIYNANMGLYRATISMQEDVARSKRFRTIYEKILMCAGSSRVIVLTHTQMADWSNDQYNPNWIYISGHTHQNNFLLRDDGTVVFSDNQVGYKPKPWHLNGFTINIKRYDPFESFPDGIHQITHEQYIEFNRCQGIIMQDMKYPGNIFALKCNGIYMFVLENAGSLCLLEGGKRHVLSHNISYYFDHLPEYIQKVHLAFAPYQKALSMLSDEVKKIGGSGTIHGCIVDIDWFNHIYLNPFDGKITPYFALDTINKVIFQNIQSLFEGSPFPPKQRDNNLILPRYLEMSKDEKLPILSRDSNNEWDLAIVPQTVLDRSMYGPSRIIRSIQYIFEQNVLRFWNDSVLSIKDNGTPAEMTV